MYYFVVNKISGNGKGLKVWKKVEKLLQEKQVNYQVRFTERPKHAVEIVKEFSSKACNAVVAVGGDGTIHDVANGLIHSNIPLGIIPAGSGNDLARALDIPMDYKRALERILRGKKRKMDVGKIGEEYCMTVTGIGFDGKVAEINNTAKYKDLLNLVRLGDLSYGLSVLHALFQYRPVRIQLKIDGEVQSFSNVWFIAIANTPNYGGGIKICPDACYDDGLFDICIVHSVTKWELLRTFPKAYKGKHVSHPSVTMIKGKQVEIIAEPPIIVQSDGEILTKTPVNVTIQKEALLIM
ncbi:diacylglycerol kinase family lipid kinase [Anoxybacillus rupiensis]|uniref:Diacylglycerol kinase family lipid kinase n=1 Tax=Anoxybacteroides rupiense TaxID=311460 RepID=A0ABT5W4Q0_9BACL|nr:MULTISPECIES: diacylglycerol kinase family protein [Anoxybacillus]MBS2770573.1 diacylglycerol kinase family lipid kinase [Anoxybacillus rupiensis]MDE8564288.1 diacylglycerol kinase family lipid kinase [Anoxybacillus rupiensis]QHC05748.1 YegS/Rv2252/BmrU family lipid kinase [Anoxybacillus sp. PDR2]